MKKKSANQKRDSLFTTKENEWMNDLMLTNLDTKVRAFLSSVYTKVNNQEAVESQTLGRR